MGYIALNILFGMIAPASDIGAIQSDLSRLWREDRPARHLRVKCAFTLAIQEEEDPAIGSRYFPSTTIHGPLEPLTRWEEDIATSGAMYRVDYQSYPPDGSEPPPNWTGTHSFNGRQSWSYSVGNRTANQYSGPHQTAKLYQDYYGDMIGFPAGEALLAATKAVSGDLNEPYQLDRLIPSGYYQFRGEEVVEGEPCVVLERPGLDRLWLAREKSWSIVRREWHWTIGGPIKRRITNRDLRPTSAGVWLPHACEMEVFGHPDTRPGQRVGTLHAVVEHLEVGVSDSWFKPSFPEGTEIFDMMTGDHYRVGKAQDHLDRTVERLELVMRLQRPLPWWRRLWGWEAGVSVLMIIVVVLLAMRMRRG